MMEFVRGWRSDLCKSPGPSGEARLGEGLGSVRQLSCFFKTRDGIFTYLFLYHSII